MELRRYYAILRRRWLLVVLTVIAGIAGGYISTSRTVVYSTQATLYVGAKTFQTNNGPYVSGDAVVGVQQIIQTFAKMVPSEPIATEALNRTGLRRSAGEVLAATQVTPDLSLIRIRVTDRDPAAAAQLANAMATAFVDKIESFEPSVPPQPGAVPQLPAYVFERAGLPTVPEPTGLTRNVILGFLFGLAAAVGAVFFLEYIDITIKSPAEAERRLELPILGVIPFDRAPAPPRPSAQRPPVVV